MSTVSGEKLQKAQAYLASLEQRASQPVPEKHSKTPGEAAGYKQWLSIEIKKARMKVEEYRGNPT